MSLNQTVGTMRTQDISSTMDDNKGMLQNLYEEIDTDTMGAD